MISGPQVVDSYFNNAEATRRQFVIYRNGKGSRKWYRTGDVMQMDSEGDLYFLSRRDNQIKIRGNRIELGEIKYTIEELTGADTAEPLPVFPDPGRPDKGVLVLFLLKEVRFADQEILRHCQSRLPPYMIPRVVLRVPTFPLNQNGKLDRHMLRQIWMENGQVTKMEQGPV